MWPSAVPSVSYCRAYGVPAGYALFTEEVTSALPNTDDPDAELWLICMPDQVRRMVCPLATAQVSPDAGRACSVRRANAQVSAADFANVQLSLSADGRVHGVLAKAAPVDGEAKPKPVRYAITSTDGGEVEPFLALVPNPIQPNRVVPCTPASYRAAFL